MYHYDYAFADHFIRHVIFAMVSENDVSQVHVYKSKKFFKQKAGK